MLQHVSGNHELLLPRWCVLQHGWQPLELHDLELDFGQGIVGLLVTSRADQLLELLKELGGAWYVNHGSRLRFHPHTYIQGMVLDLRRMTVDGGWGRQSILPLVKARKPNKTGASKTAPAQCNTLQLNERHVVHV